VVGGSDDSLGAEELVQVVDVSPLPLDLAVLALVNPEDVDMDALLRVGEPGLDLLGNEEVRQVGLLIEQARQPSIES